ncbi:MAG: response regulator [Magnetococcales bacterium]|nr:response regulator [Magnetococcales bacterium]
MFENLGQNNTKSNTDSKVISQHDIKSAKILVVDDKPDNLDILVDQLEEFGYTKIVSTLDPTEGVKLYTEQNFDLVLLDIMMPIMNGFEVLEVFESVGKNIPVIVLTALQDKQTKLKALNAGAKDFLTKPFDSDEVQARVRNLLEAHLAQKRLSIYSQDLEQQVLDRTLELSQKNSELIKTQLHVVQRLGRAGEFRDSDTGLHVVRMSHYSHILGKACGMQNDESFLLLHAASMHDIGKIGVPDRILLKPGKLDSTEWDIMQQHAKIGAEIIGKHPSELLEMARAIALTHHEKWDGTGYPNGLRGTDIPLVGRIVALADVFDALTTKRPYKKAWPLPQVIALIKEEKGKHFDPDLIPLFLDLMPEILKIKDQHQEVE